MAESAAKRDRVDPAVAPSWYLWEAPGKPASVYLSFEVIDRLEHETLDTFRSLTSRGSEMGGILLGSVVPGASAAIYVEDYESVECDYSRGPLYRLSDADLSRFEKALEDRSGSGPRHVVGFFRSHTRKGLVLDAEDLQFLGARFRNPYSLALLIRPFATRASVGGIFLHEENGFNNEASALEFAFRSSQLVASKRGPDLATVAPAPARAQVVPIASRREVPAAPPVPAASAVAAPSPQLPFEGSPVGDALEPEDAAAGTVLPSSRVAFPSAFESREPEVTESVSSAQAPPVTVASPAVETRPLIPNDPLPPSFTLHGAPALIQTSPGRKLPIFVGVLAAAVLVLVLLFIYPGFLNHRQAASPIASLDGSPLTLRIEHTGTDLLLTWNRDSAAIRNATRAALSISDGDRHENYDMDRAQLQTGSIVYSPMGGDVSFQMEVIGNNGSHTATEILRVLRTRPSPMPEQAQQLKSDKLVGENMSSSSSESSPAAADSSKPPADVAAGQVPVRSPVKPFDASSLVARLRPAQPAELADLPRPAATDTVAPRVNAEGSLPFSSVPAMAALPLPAPPSPPSAPVAGTRSNSAVGGQIQAAQLVSRREPEYPPLARQMGAKGLVELIATIGTDGNVKAVKVISGSPLLARAAQDAVLHWRYRPTMLNGVPVQNETRITLNFIPQQ